MSNTHGQTVTYLRVSSDTQQLDRQDELREHADRVFEEYASAATRQRPVLTELIAYVRDGDTVRVWSMDRLARSLTDLLALVKELNGKGVTVSFTKERLDFVPHHDDPMSTLLLHVMGAVAEFERSVIRQRQAEGIAKAKQQGKYTGRQPVLAAAQVDEAKARLALGLSKAQVARELGVSRSTLHRALDGTLVLRGSTVGPSRRDHERP
ncbi:recombinase family protein [Nocardioides sambongensis]|uniref:recombinase family protein n=1 Tax=Nocardioides sambongensis TaxID=2589074 RepID=UPI00112CA42C|nr:recombinase family protein [Nocardioides sambongensis]